MHTLTEIDQWITWKGPTKRPQGSINKVRLTFQDALQRVLEGKADGIGFILTKDDPYVVIDLDDSLGPAGPSEWAMTVITQFDSYTEVSPSGKGYHIWCKGKTKKPGLRKGNTEMYSSGRYMTVTLDPLIPLRGIVENQHAIDWLENNLAKP